MDNEKLLATLKYVLINVKDAFSNSDNSEIVEERTTEAVLDLQHIISELESNK